jgi:hypothetical protein
LSNSSQVSNSAFIFSHNVRVFVSVHVEISVHVFVSDHVQTVAHVLISHVHVVSHELTSLHVFVGLLGEVMETVKVDPESVVHDR